MISYNKFVKLIHTQLLSPINVGSIGFSPNWSTKVEDFKFVLPGDEGNDGHCIWWHEEPINTSDFNSVIDNNSCNILNPHMLNCLTNHPILYGDLYDVYILFFANSEISECKKENLKRTSMQDWYFFFHGFAALDWYRNFKYFKFNNKITKVFICLNHLLNNKRSYRLYLLSQLMEKNLLMYGYVSAPLLNENTIKIELNDIYSDLTKDSKNHIIENLYKNAAPLILDSGIDYLAASADIISEEFACGALWHIVTETVFYDKKLHLTEKIFKPIVVHRPFILVGAPGNLKYFKNYGFKTFDRWIDESYDEIEDNDLRLKKIVTEIEKLCRLSQDELEQMHSEMHEILNYNYNHFYGKFKEIIIDEMLINFQKCIHLYNKDKSERFRVPEGNLNYKSIKEVLMS
jgi:hypothetical protein